MLNAGMRLEASAFNPAAVGALERLRAAVDVVPLLGPGGLGVEANAAFRFNRVLVAPEYGIPFLGSVEIIEMRPEAEKFLSRTETKRVESLRVKKWDLLISRSGTIGNVALAGETLAGAAVSEDVIRWRADAPETAGYAAAWLRSQTGRLQLEQVTYGSVIVHIEPHHLRRILVPKLHPIKQAEIGRSMCAATDQRDEANRLLDRAEREMLDALGLAPASTLDDFTEPAPYTTVPASELGRRLEASYHHPSLRRLEERMRAIQTPTAPLADPRVGATIHAVTRFRKRVYVPSGIPLLNSRQLFQIDPIALKYIAEGAHLDDLDEITLRENMVLVTCSGTNGRAQIVPRFMDGWAASQDALRVIASDPLQAGYLYAWLASGYGRRLVNRHTYGSVVTHVDRDMLGAVRVPLPDAAVRERVGALVLQANELRSSAWAMERQAINELDAISG